MANGQIESESIREHIFIFEPRPFAGSERCQSHLVPTVVNEIRSNGRRHAHNSLYGWICFGIPISTIKIADCSMCQSLAINYGHPASVSHNTYSNLVNRKCIETAQTQNETPIKLRNDCGRALQMRMSSVRLNAFSVKLATTKKLTSAAPSSSSLCSHSIVFGCSQFISYFDNV